MRAGTLPAAVTPGDPHTAALAGLGSRLDELGPALAAAVHAAVPALPRDLRAETEATCLALAVLAIGRLRSGGRPAVTELCEAAAVLVQDAVERGLAVEDMHAVARAWHGAFAQRWLEQLHAEVHDRDALAAATAAGSAWLFAFVDAVTRVLARRFTVEQDRWARSAVAQRRALVAALLDGGEADAAGAGSRLRYRLQGRHLAFVLWCGDAGASEEDALLGAADAVAAALGAMERLRLPVGGSTVHGWAAVDGAPDPVSATAPLAEMLAALGVRVAFGEAGEGLDGFRSSHEQALRAQRVAVLGDRAPGARIRFDDVSLLVLMTQDPEETERFLERELGPLREPTAAMRRLAETARVYLDEGASHVAAGRRLGVHENTVGYRVRRASELLGRRVEGGGLRLHAALQLHAALAPADG